MDSPHALRSKGWAGLAFVFLIVASVILSGTPPNANASPTAIAAYLADHHQGLIVAGWLTFPTLAFFLWFVVGIAGYLRRMSANDEGLPAYAITSAVYTAVVAFVASLITTGLVFVPADVLAPRTLQFVWALSALVNGSFLAMGLAIFVFACAHSMRRHNSGPNWVVWLGYASATGDAIMSLGVFYPSGIAFNNVIVSLVLGFVLFAVWMIGASVTLIAQASRQLAGAVA